MSIAAPRTPAEHEQARAFDAGYATAQEEIDRLTADNATLRAALEEVRQQIYALMPDGWSDAPYVISIIDRALANK